MTGPPAGEAHQAAGKLAQLLGEVIVHHAPWTAQISEAEKWRQTEQFLEGLESHTAEKIGPVLAEMFDGVNVPEPLRPIIADAIGPQAQFSAIVTQIVLYGVVSQLLGSSMQPFIQGLQNDLWAKAVSAGISVPVTPAVIATAAARGLNLGDPPTVTMPDWAYQEAARSGVSAEDIDLQASIVGTPPAPQELFELLRRGIIQEADVRRGLAEGDTRDDWIPQLVQLAHGWLTPLDFVRAAVQGQMSYQDAARWAAATGLDTSTALPIDAAQVGGSDDMFGLAWAIAGRPPGPVQLADMALRGIIPKDGTGAGATTFQQGIAESDVKTKWTDALWRLAQYVPPPASIGTLLEHGAITKDQAVTLWEQRGVPAELADGYAYMAEQQHIGQDKLLAKGEVLTAYFDHLIPRDDAKAYLSQLGYRDAVADEILDIQDFKREIQTINTVIRRIGGLYAAHKLSAANAKTALISLDVPSAQADRLLSYWEVERLQPIRLPTVREIGMAAKHGTITETEALAELDGLGYQPRDAAIVLSAYLGAAVTPLPPAGSGVTG